MSGGSLTEGSPTHPAGIYIVMSLSGLRSALSREVRNTAVAPLPCTAATQAHLDNNAHNNVTLDAYLFAPPNAGDAVFAEAFNQRVNARRLPFIYDLIPQVRMSPAWRL